MKTLIEKGLIAAVAMLGLLPGASAKTLAPVRSGVVLSDRWSAAFFEVKRDGQVVGWHDCPSEGGRDELFDEPMFRVANPDLPWTWRGGYLPVLGIGEETELVACGERLYARQGAEYSKWPGGEAIDAEEFEQAADAMCAYWERWFAKGRHLPSVDPRVDAAWKSSLVQALSMYAGYHPHYGAGFYRVLIHDAFPPTTIATVETLVQFGHADEAAETLLYYLRRYVRADGSIDYYGPSISEYGGLMWVSAITMAAETERAGEIAAALRPLVRRALEMFQFQTVGTSGEGLGEHRILAGVPEADTRGRPAEYFHNNYQMLLGLKLIAPAYAALGERELAQEVESVAKMFGMLLEKAYVQKRDELGLMPFMASQSAIPSDIQSSLDSGYANYRYYPELIETGLLPKADVVKYCEYREGHNGEYENMCLLNVTNAYDEVDNWPVASYARGLLEYGETERFERVLDGHLENYISDDTFTAYEQVANRGNPRRPVAPSCVPVQLALPRLWAWKCLGYRPWKSYLPLKTVSGLRLFQGGIDRTGCAIYDEGDDIGIRFEVEDRTLTYAKSVQGKRDIEIGDRVEIYFAPDGTLKNWYYGVEVDPLGRVLDYRVKLYRQFDYDFAFKSVRAEARVTDRGYSVRMAIAKAELKELGIDLKSAAIGIFRADYSAPGELVDWASAAPFPSGEADFHQPKMFLR